MATPTTPDAGGARLRLALDLYAAGEELMRANLRRRHPGASDAELESKLRAWLAHRPGAEHGDCPGRPRTLSEP